MSRVASDGGRRSTVVGVIRPVGAVDDGSVRSSEHLAPLIVAAPSGYEYDPWRAMHLDVDRERLMLFDPVDGRRLTSDALAVSSPA